MTAHSRRQRQRIVSGVLLVALVLAGLGCESDGPDLLPPQRLNQTQGNVVAGLLPNYTALSVRGSHVATAWIGAAAAGQHEVVLRFSADAGKTWGPEQRFDGEPVAPGDAGDPRLYRFPGSEDLLVLWEAGVEKARRRMIVARTSPDQGKTFAPAEVVGEGVKVFDPVAISWGTQSAAVVWEQQAAAGRQLFIAGSENGGRGWVAMPGSLDPSLAGFSRQPSLVALPANRILAVWSQRSRRNRGGATRPHLRASVGRDGGRQWSPSVPVDPRFEGRSPIRPQAIHADGQSSVVWTTALAGAQDRGAVVFSQATQDGLTWSAPRELFVGEEAPFALLQAKGKYAYLSWHGGSRKDVGIYFLVSANGGRSWREAEADPLRLDDPLVPGNALRPAMQADGEGRVVISWTTGYQKVWLRASTDHGQQWSAPILIAEEKAGGKLKYPQVAIAGDRAFVTWERWPNKDLHIKSIADVGKSWPLDLFFRSVELARETP